MRSIAVWLGLSALIVVLDQTTKQAILHTIALGQTVEVLPPVFSLVLTYQLRRGVQLPGAGIGLAALFLHSDRAGRVDSDRLHDEKA